MSLINQMLKDLEQRGAGSTDTEKQISSKLNATLSPFPEQKSSFKFSSLFIKISILIVLLAGGVFLWNHSDSIQTKSSAFVKSFTFDLKKKTDINSPTSMIAPKPIETAANEMATNHFVNKKNVASETKIENKLRFKPTAANALKRDEKESKILANYSSDYENKSEKNLELNVSSTIAKPIEAIEPATHKTPELAAVALKTAALSTIDNAAVGKQIRPEQKSENFYRQAISNLQQGRVTEAQEALTKSLDANPANQEARQMLTGLLLDNKRNDEARVILATGLAITPEQSDFRMVLARLQVEAGDRSGALSTLELGQKYAINNAEYQSFLAIMLQRAERHEEAINHYNIALSLNSSAANSLIGLGISLQATGKLKNAQEAFTRAQSVTSLSPELAQFIDQQLKQINQNLQNSASK